MWHVHRTRRRCFLGPRDPAEPGARVFRKPELAGIRGHHRTQSLAVGVHGFLPVRVRVEEIRHDGTRRAKSALTRSEGPIVVRRAATLSAILRPNNSEVVVMQFRRRDALKVLGGATLATLVDPAFAKVKPLKVLILGGTGFIGPHFVDVL